MTCHKRWVLNSISNVAEIVKNATENAENFYFWLNGKKEMISFDFEGKNIYNKL